MYNYKKANKTRLNINSSTEGEPIETKIERITNNKEPITDGAPLIYTERKEGVLAGYNPRTDKWEIAIEAMDTVSKTNIAKREQRHSKKDDNIIELKPKEPPKNGENESGA